MLTDAEKQEIFQRLIHIEQKLDALGGKLPIQAYNGHADQAFGHLTFSQFGEDLIIANIFAQLSIATPSYIDIGAHHPLNVSNTALMHMRGSRGINVEANPDLVSAFFELRPEDTTLNVGVGVSAARMSFYRIDAHSGRNTFDRVVAEAFIREHPEFRISDVLEIDVLPLTAIIDQFAGGNYPDFLTIDIEGFDFQVLEAADFSRSRPKVICVEAISGANSDDSPRISALLQSRGYEQHARTLGNIIFVDGRLRGRLPT